MNKIKFANDMLFKMFFYEQVNSVWFKMFIYHLTGCGPPSLLIVKGTKLKKLPKVFQVIFVKFLFLINQTKIKIKTL